MGQNGTNSEGRPTRSTRARRGLHACSWRPGPRAGRRGQRGAAHQWVPAEESVRKALLVQLSPPRSAQSGTSASTAAQRIGFSTIGTRFPIYDEGRRSGIRERNAHMVSLRSGPPDAPTTICTTSQSAWEMRRTRTKRCSWMSFDTVMMPAQRQQHSPDGPRHWPAVHSRWWPSVGRGKRGLYIFSPIRYRRALEAAVASLS